MNNRNKIIWSVLGVVLFIIVLFGREINDGLGCLAYYEQCTANRVEGLTKEQCMSRDDVVGFLHEGDICLVKQSE